MLCTDAAADTIGRYRQLDRPTSGRGDSRPPFVLPIRTLKGIVQTKATDRSRRCTLAILLAMALTAVSGFLAHPDWTKESPQHASGNYASVDQNAALKWGAVAHRGFRGRPEARDDRGRISPVNRGQRADGFSAIEESNCGGLGESGSILGTVSVAPL